ncbi:MAG: phage holin family protein [Solirubrobacteraceae bacterium]
MAAEPQEEVPANIAAAITEISEHATLLIRDEIELAKAEVGAKLRKLLTGAVVGVTAGVFIVLAGLFVLIGLAYLISYELNASELFWGFFIMAALMLVLAALGGWLAFRAVRGGAPPAPTMAIDEARKIREAVREDGG